MPADLLPKEAIAGVAARVNAPDTLRVLRRIQRERFIFNNAELDGNEAALLEDLADLGLVDAGYEGPTDRRPVMWVSNGNGSRVLAHLTGIASGPHYEVPSAELAGWVEQQGPDRWWNVDGDPLLTGRLTFPCPASKLAGELQKIARPLLVQARKSDSEARGQEIGRGMLDAVAGRLSESMHLSRGGERPPWSDDRVLYLRWKGSPHEWLLEEDSETTAQMHANDRGRAVDEAQVTKRE